MAKKKILILGPYLYKRAGVSNFTQLLLNQLSILNYNVKYFPIGGRKNSVYTIFLPLYQLIDTLHFIMIMLSFKPDVTHINPSLSQKSLIRDTIYLFLAKVMKYKVLLFIHGWHKKTYKYFTGNSYCVKHWLRRVFFSCDKIIVLANKFRKQLVEFGTESSKIEVFPIMVEYEKYFDSKSQNKNYRNTDMNILFLAKFVRDKGIYEVVEAIPLVLEKMKNRRIKFILAGDGPEMCNISKLITAFGINDFVEFAGFVTGQEKIEILKKANLFVYPSFHEGFPTVIAEIMVAGLPIISTGVGAISEVIEDGINGIILSKPDGNELATTIVKLLSKPRLMRRMSKNNQRKAKDYDVSIVCNRLTQVYESL